MMRPTLCIDVGCGTTKLGFSGNAEPSCIFRTHPLDPPGVHLPSSFPNAALSLSLEFWQDCFVQRLRVDTEEHNVALVEPPGSDPDGRGGMAEVMFETFNVAGLYLGPSPLLALYGSSSSSSDCMTGLVVDAGQFQTRVVPVLGGRVLHSCLHTLPLGGHDLTLQVQQVLRGLGEEPPAHAPAAVHAPAAAAVHLAYEEAQQVKELFGSCCSDVEHELPKHQSSAAMYRQYSSTGVQEQLLAADVFFSPKVPHSQSLPQVVDSAIQCSPIDARRAMYSNILLTGSALSFPGMCRRLQDAVQELCNARLSASAKAVEVHVTRGRASHAAWSGASRLASSPQFPQACCSREQYQEYGPDICMDVGRAFPLTRGR